MALRADTRLCSAAMTLDFLGLVHQILHRLISFSTDQDKASSFLGQETLRLFLLVVL